MSIRAFIAIEISEGIRKKLALLQERLKKGATFLPLTASWVKPENIHITLKFLGKTEEDKIKKIVGEIKEALKGIESFRINFQGLGVFPNERQPRVLWVGIKEGERELREIQQRLEMRLAGLGFPAEERGFHPHLTLARIKSVKESAGFMKIVSEHQQLSNLGECFASEVVLFRSDLHPDGAVYTPLEKVKLKK